MRWEVFLEDAKVVWDIIKRQIKIDATVYITASKKHLQDFLE